MSLRYNPRDRQGSSLPIACLLATLRPMNKEILWRTLFLILLTVNVTLLATSGSGYSSIFGPLNASLQEDFESSLQDSPSYYGRHYGKSQESIAQLKSLKPPFWKNSRHQEYVI